jgi:hypothetical protein
MHQYTLTAYLRWMIVEATSIEYIEPLGDQTLFPFQVMFREEKFQNENEEGKEILTHEPDLESETKKKGISYSTLGFPYSHELQY